jgi:hypothetical protein
MVCEPRSHFAAQIQAEGACILNLGSLIVPKKKPLRFDRPKMRQMSGFTRERINPYLECFFVLLKRLSGIEKQTVVIDDLKFYIGHICTPSSTQKCSDELYKPIGTSTHKQPTHVSSLNPVPFNNDSGRLRMEISIGVRSGQKSAGKKTPRRRGGTLPAFNQAVHQFPDAMHSDEKRG